MLGAHRCGVVERDFGKKIRIVHLNLVECTNRHEARLADQTDLHAKRHHKKHEKMACGAFTFLRATFYCQRSVKTGH
jgi:hypothetical protein